MDWRKVIDVLERVAVADAKHAQEMELLTDQYHVKEHYVAMVERLRINSNICSALAEALKAGLGL